MHRYLKHPTVPYRPIAALLASMVILSPAAMAQEMPEARAQVQTTAETTDTTDQDAGTPSPAGIAAGSFRIFPSITLSHGLDSNLYGEPRGETRGWVTTVTPAVEVRSQWARHGITLSTGADVLRYPSHSAEDTEDYWLKLDGHYDLSDRARAFGQAYARRDHEERGSPESSSGETPTIYDTKGLVAGIHKNFGDLTLRAGVVREQIDYDSPAGITGTNDDRDRTLDSVGLRASYAVAEGLALFAQYATDVRAYDQSVDDNGFDRDSRGDRLSIGTSGGAGAMRWEAFVGSLRQDYDDRRLKDVHRPYIGAVVKWQAARATRVTTRLSQTLNESTLAGASGYFTTALSTRIEHAIDRHWLVDGSLGYGRSDYQGIALTNRSLRGNLGVRYYLNDDWFAGVSYRYLHRGSTQAAYDYFDDLLMVSIGYAPNQRSLRWPGEPAPLAAAFVPVTPSGLYLGLGGGTTTTATSTFGGRDNGVPANTDDGGFSGSGALGALFAGYGVALHSWQLALEAGFSRGDTAWSHTHVGTLAGATDRNFSMRSGDTVNLAVRAGRDMLGGQLYAHAGVVWTDFESAYFNAATDPDTVVDQENTRRGLRWGVGTEVPMGRHAFLRSEYAYTDYDGVNVFDGQNTQRFSPAASQVMLGLGWRFGGNGNTPPPPPAAVDLNGFYAGVGARQAMLSTDLATVQGTDNSLLNADFGNQSTALDLFAGWGRVFKRLFLGVEIDMATSDFGWAHDRVVSGAGGRDFSQDRKGSYGAGVRLGYVVAPGAMVYARIGEERAKFDTRYARGNATPVQFADYRHGTRLGLGSEMALGPRSFFRIEYSEVDFGEVSFIAPAQANGDAVTLDTRESRVDLAWGVRF